MAARKKNSATGNEATKTEKPLVFMGSSREGLTVAQNLHAGLEDFCLPRLWNMIDSFELSAGTLDELLRHSKEVQFAVMIFTPDDKIYSRGQEHRIARDNVILELGLFMGALGQRRVFIVHPKNKPPKLPTDLLGITTAQYDENNASIPNSLLNAILKIKDAMQRELALDASKPKLQQVIKRVLTEIVSFPTESLTIAHLTELLEVGAIRGDACDELTIELKKRAKLGATNN